MVNKRYFSSGILLLVFLAQPCLAASAPARVGDRVYLKGNVWGDDDHRILSPNYHEGRLIPAGTEVIITEMAPTVIRFETTANRTPYFILNVKRYYMDITAEELEDTLFSAENPVEPGGPFEKFTEEERKNIRFGTLEEGMSRNAVLMAYGYPPGYQHSPLQDSIWVYRESPRYKRVVYFENDQVARIAGSEER